MSRRDLSASGLDISSFVKEDAADAFAVEGAFAVGGAGGGGAAAMDSSGKPVILQYAAYLGMDIAADTDLLWIAQQALVAELPPGWTEHADPMSGDAYFHNAQTGETVWEHPCDSYYRNLCAWPHMPVPRSPCSHRASVRAPPGRPPHPPASLCQPGSAASACDRCSWRHCNQREPVRADTRR